MKPKMNIYVSFFFDFYVYKLIDFVGFATPSLTPHVSDRSTTEYFDLEVKNNLFF